MRRSTSPAILLTAATRGAVDPHIALLGMGYAVLAIIAILMPPDTTGLDMER